MDVDDRSIDAWLRHAERLLGETHGDDWLATWREGVARRHGEDGPAQPNSLVREWRQLVPRRVQWELVSLLARLPELAAAVDEAAGYEVADEDSHRLDRWSETLKTEYRAVQRRVRPAGPSAAKGAQAVSVSDGMAEVHVAGGLDALHLEVSDSIVQITVNTSNGRRSLDDLLDDHRRRLRALRHEGGADLARRYDALAAEVAREAEDLAAYPAVAADLLGLVGQIHLQRGQAEHMHEATGRALTYDPQCSTALLCLGEYHLKRGRASGSATEYAQAADHYRLAAAGTARSAVRWLARYNEVLALDGAGRRREARDRLTELRASLPPGHGQLPTIADLARQLAT